MSIAAQATPGGGNPTPDEVLTELERLRNSRQLRESHQLQGFLEFIVRETLSGNQDSLKEYLLGCQVFGRRADYDPRHDAIVRVQATVLRKRLESYYDSDGAPNGVRIELPRGGYVPAFHYVVPMEEPEPPVPSTPPQRSSKGLVFAAFVGGCVVTAALILLLLPWRKSPLPYQMTRAAASDFPQLWAPFVAKDRPALVAFGVPLFYSSGGLYFRDVHVNRPGTERDGRVAELGEKLRVMMSPNDDIYTGLGELQGTNLVSNFLASNGMPVRVTSARAIGASNIRQRNLIVISSLRFQTLLEDMNLPADFEFIPTSPEAIRNRHPLRGEPETYTSVSGAGVTTSYALASVWPGLTTGTRILYIAGVHTWATQAATEFLLRPEELRKLAQEFRSDIRTHKHGVPSPYFEILLRVEGRGNALLEAEYVTHHYLRADAKTQPGKLQ